MRPPDKTRYLQAARREVPVAVPFQELEFAPHIVHGLLGKPEPKVRCYEIPALDLVTLYRLAGCDMAYAACIWELGRKNFIDELGRKHYVDGLFKTRAMLDEIVFPELDVIRKRFDEIFAALDGTGMGLIYGPNPVPFTVTTAIGYQDYYESLILDPGFVTEFQKRIFDWCMGELEVALEYPVDVIRIGAVLCTKQGLMMSRESLERFEYPFLREAVRRISAQKRLTLLHADGLMRGLLPDMIDIGFDVFHPIEPCDGAQDIADLKARFGDHLAFQGNVDVAGVLGPGSPDDVRRATRALLDRMAPGGGYICGSSHDISADVPIANLLAMRDAVHAYGGGAA